VLPTYKTALDINVLPLQIEIVPTYLSIRSNLRHLHEVLVVEECLIVT